MSPILYSNLFVSFVVLSPFKDASTIAHQATHFFFFENKQTNMIFDDERMKWDRSTFLFTSPKERKQSIPLWSDQLSFFFLSAKNELSCLCQRRVKLVLVPLFVFCLCSFFFVVVIFIIVIFEIAICLVSLRRNPIPKSSKKNYFCFRRSLLFFLFFFFFFGVILNERIGNQNYCIFVVFICCSFQQTLETTSFFFFAKQ